MIKRLCESETNRIQSENLLHSSGGDVDPDLTVTYMKLLHYHHQKASKGAT